MNPRTRRVWAFALYVISLAAVQGADWHVSPSGRPDGSGSPEFPLDLATALSAHSPALPGDTLLLRGGRYIGKFSSHLNGVAGEPITVRSHPGEWATIDSGISEDRRIILQINGSWTIFRDFEVMSSDPVRVTGISGSYPSDIRRGEGIQVRGPNTKLINLVVHDTAQGIGAWSEAPDTEIYGCIIYYNGWQAPDRAHGHGIYSQNLHGKRLIRDNIIFSQFEKGIQIYGSSLAHIRNHWVEGNIVFNNGVLSREQAVSENLTLYGGNGPEGCVIRDNLFYGSRFEGKLVVGGAGAKDLVFQNNYVPHLSRIRHWQTAIVTGNTFCRDSTVMEYHYSPNDYRFEYEWDANTYYDQESRYSPFNFIQLTTEGTRSAGLSFETWKQVTGFDLSSSYSKSRPSGSKIVVRPNVYDPNRAHIAVYNWERSPILPVDLNSTLIPGQLYEIYSAQNCFGAPVVSGHFDGTAVWLPCADLPVAAPIGAFPPIATAPEFNAFILKSGPAPAAMAPTHVVPSEPSEPPAELPVSTLSPANTAPVISSIPDQLTYDDRPTSEILLMVADAETPAENLTVTARPSTPIQVPPSNILLSGFDNLRTIKVIPAAGQYGSTIIYVTVSDGEKSSQTSFVFTSAN